MYDGQSTKIRYSRMQTTLSFAATYRVFQKELYKFVSLYKIYSEGTYSALNCHNVAHTHQVLSAIVTI
jgi:hypothetical protein